MGPYRLNSLMNSTGAMEDVNLKDAANDWRLKGGQPTVVLDCLNFARKFYDPDEKRGTDVICNGEYKKIAQNMKSFIQAFKDVSIELVFFFDGPADETKLKSWINRRQKRLEENLKSFDCIESTPMSQLKLDVFPCMILPVMKEVLKEERVTIVRGVDDHDKEMAKYVVDNNCLGIFSDDTDFVVFDKIPNVYSTRPNCLDLQNMKTKVYHRQKFLKRISLNPKAMPVFATLLGNDYIKTEDAQAYSKRKFNSVFLKLGEATALAGIANRIYAESESMEEMAKTLANEMKHDSKVILDSLRSYDLDIRTSANVESPSGISPWDSVVALCLKKFKEGYIENQTLSIIKRQLCTQSEKFEDPRDSHVNALKGLRQRIYSILLHEKPADRQTVTVTEILAGGANSMERHPVQLLKVEVEHPGILKLWNCGEDLNDKRWALVWWALRSHHPRPAETLIPFQAVSGLRELSDHLVIVGLALLYLDKVVKQLSEKERAMLMVLATSIPHLNVAKLSENRVERTTKRAANLATLYMQTYVYVRWVMDVCGLRLNAKSRDAYSGQLFHYLFQLNDPEQFFDVSGGEARKSYTLLRVALNMASAIGTPQPLPTENPGFSNEDNQTKQDSVGSNRGDERSAEDSRRIERKAEDDRKDRRSEDDRRDDRRSEDSRRDERRAEDDRRDGRRTEEDRRDGRRSKVGDGDSSEERRGQRRLDRRENERQSREDTYCERRHLGERRRNYTQRSGPNQRRRFFNDGRRGQNNRFRGSGSDRSWRPQDQRRHRRGFSRNSGDRRYY